jgi:benzoyl-CoA reductase/2-hydroxyglutaryl-CoA dehydratase subunit BcrC/BadD/HgdB
MALCLRLDSTRVLDSLALAYTYPILNRGTGHKLNVMRQMIDDYEIDGVILHSDRSCKPYSVGQMDQRDRILQEEGIPALLLEADHSDSRAFAEAQVGNRLAAFIEMLEGRSLRSSNPNSS